LVINQQEAKIQKQICMNELAGVTIRSRCWFYKAKSRVIKSSMLLITGKGESVGKSNYPDPAVVETNTQQGGR